VEIIVEEDDGNDTLVICVRDNGKGMSEEFLKTVQDPFITTRNTRKIGLGISFFKEAAEMTGGSLELDSTPGVGTVITGNFVKSHIDRQPIGDLSGTIVTLVQLNPFIDFEISYKVNTEEFAFTTQEVKLMLGDDVTLNSPPVVSFLTEYIKENIANLSGGAH